LEFENKIGWRQLAFEQKHRPNQSRQSVKVSSFHFTILPKQAKLALKLAFGLFLFTTYHHDNQPTWLKLHMASQ
jgi:hypothetical protein